MGQEGCHGSRTEGYAEYKREAMAMPGRPGVTVAKLLSIWVLEQIVWNGGGARITRNDRKKHWRTDA